VQVVQVDEHAVDAVLVAGVALLLLGGNHDSVATLSESRELLACLSATVVATAEDPAAQVRVLPLRGGQGKAGCIVCAIPFIRPRDVQSQAGLGAEDKQQPASGDTGALPRRF